MGIIFWIFKINLFINLMSAYKMTWIESNKIKNLINSILQKFIYFWRIAKMYWAKWFP
jgi:hypothetical protein